MFEFDLNADAESLPGLVRKGIGLADPPELGARDWLTITLALRGRDGSVVVGLYGASMWSWLMIDGIWVEEKLRGQGWGQSLVAGRRGNGGAARMRGLLAGYF